jgi:hypothetical protein
MWVDASCSQDIGWLAERSHEAHSGSQDELAEYSIFVYGVSMVSFGCQYWPSSL